MKKDTNGSIVPLLIVAVIVIIGAVGFFVLRNDKANQDNSQSTNTSEQSSAEATKSETEKKFETYVGEDYDRYYMAMMIGHHQGAIDMAELAQTKAKHTELKDAADDIISSQTKEINDMIAWQKAWGFPASTGEMMEDHSAMGMEMENTTMMSELNNASGDGFDKKFLELMIEHHESAVAMSRPANKNALHAEIKTLANAIIQAQESEITQMKEWLVEWGYES